ncbi:hypothetical protein FSP39_023417 [Pinctada imbricata]|uniref:RanBP2-type domain-containing protein n=1 Tax=Pinctada imbricata TaxID=66713 RepID=A0AA89BLB7_PINIB|nr:hypothetical protein FSP39_023417 [Pinctada imbricata]
MGYVPVQGSRLLLSKRLNTDIALAVAFECLLASVECSIISEIYQCVGDRCEVSKVVKCRLEHSGNIEETVAKLKKQYDLSSYVFVESRKADTRTQLKPVSDIQADYVGSSPSSPTDVPSPRGFGKDKDVPYIDEDVQHNENERFEEGTLDDHLMASLRLVSSTSEKDKRTQSTQEPKKASDEWSFVHDKLRKEYGDSYYHGERGDVLRDEGICLDKDESERETGVISHMGSKRTSGYVSASQGDRSKSVVHGVNSRKITQDSGIAEKSPLPSQQVFYPPEDAIASFSRSRGPASSTVPGELPRQRSSAYAHAELAKSYPGGQSYEARGVTSPVQASGASMKTRENNSVSSPASFSNFSHSAPILRNTATGSEYVAGGAQLQNKRWPADSWTCPHCTVQNNTTLSVCVVCGKSRTEPVRKMVVQSKEKKNCPQCTFLNVLDAMECEVCQSAFM